MMEALHLETDSESDDASDWELEENEELEPASTKLKPKVPVYHGHSDLIIDTDKRLCLIIKSGNFLMGAITSPTIIPSKETGRLNAFIMELPLDLIYEIAKYLRPHDLQNFIRLNKRFRAVFLQRSATTVWRQCIANTRKLPPCPPDMTEPQYVSFMIAEAFCMACGKDEIPLPYPPLLGPNAPFPELDSYPTLRLRLCTECSGKNLIKGSELSNKINEDSDMIFRLLNVIPSSDNSFYCSGSQCVRLKELESFSYFKPEADIIISEYHQAKEANNVEQFLNYRRYVKDSMTKQGKNMCQLFYYTLPSGPPGKCGMRKRIRIR